jgi:hypothetical protein
VERECVRVSGRGALLGPEESGRVSSEAWTGFPLGHGSTGLCWLDGWLGPALTKLLVGSLDGCVVSLDGVLVRCVVVKGLVFLPVF